MKFTHFNDLNFSTDHRPNALFNCRYTSWIPVIKNERQNRCFVRCVNFSNRSIWRFYSIVYLHVDAVTYMFIDFVQRCASVCERTNNRTFLETFLSVRPSVLDHVPACSTVIILIILVLKRWSRTRGPYGYLRTWNWPITAREISRIIK